MGGVLGVLLVGLASTGSTGAVEDPIAAALDSARASGSYRFTSEVEHLTTPTATVLNAGRNGRVEHLYLSGETDIARASSEFQLWSGGATNLQDDASLALRVVDGQTFKREAGGDWSEVGDATGGLAPGGDFLSYLSAATGIIDLGTETRAGQTFTRYGFQVDGPTFAAATRRQMQDSMRRSGELAPGSRLGTPGIYRDMTGSGELWVDASGRPLRESLTLQFPEQDSQEVSAQITVDFSDFGYAGPTSLLDRLRTDGEETRLIVAVVLLGAMAAVMIRSRGGRGAVGQIAVVVVLALVLQPLGDPAMASTDGSSSPLADNLQGDQAATDATELSRDAEAARTAAIADPHTDQLTAGERQTLLASRTGELPLPGSAPSAARTQNAPATARTHPSDRDHDGLTDFVEERIGTDPGLDDTDADGVDDGAEVLGFTVPGGTATWYGDPTVADSNNDGISDGGEWSIDGDTIPDDTDGDTIPDVFDTDNDNDGVPDRLDSAPFSVVETPFTVADGLALTIDNSSESNVATFVDFELRPTDPEQLRFALNKLDWPADDQGQIRDINEKDEDLTLIPMLEITIPDESHQLPSPAQLVPFGISVSPASHDDDDFVGVRTAYVPLNVITDQQSGERVAFGGRMHYLSQVQWGPAHTARLAWAVQVANDVPCDTDDPCPDNGYALDQQQVVHTYFSDWILTSLAVTEEHGADIAQIYEDPSADGDPAHSGPTWALSQVLEQRYLTANPDAEPNTPNDVTPANIAETFDRLDEQNRTAMYGLPNIFRVRSATRLTMGEGAVASEETNLEILGEPSFSVAWRENHSITPVIMSVYSTSNRSLAMDGLLAGNGSVALSDRHMTLDFAGTAINTIAGMKWTAYCGGDLADADWVRCDDDEFLGDLDTRYGDRPIDDQVDPDITKGQNIVMQMYALTLLQGVTAVLVRDGGDDDVQYLGDQFASQGDADLAATISGYQTGTAAAAIPKFIANRVLLNSLENGNALLRRIGQRGLFSQLTTTSGRTGALAVGVIIMIGAFATAAYFSAEGDPDAQIALSVLTLAATAGAGLVLPLYQLTQITKIPQLAGLSTIQLLSLRSEAVGLSRTAAAIGAGIAVAVTWGAFVYSIVSNGVTAFGPEFNRALASTIAATIFIVLLAVISLTVIGLIIVGVVAVIDAIFALACELGADDLKTSTGCFSLGGLAIKAITVLLFGADLMVNTSTADLVVPGSPMVALHEPEMGYTVGNALDVSLEVTTNIVHKGPEPENWQMFEYLWFYTPGNLRTSTFRHSLTSPNAATIAVAREQMADEWQDVVVDHPFGFKSLYRGSAEDDLSIPGGVPFGEAGLNQIFAIHLNSGYAIPSFECWTAIVLPVCYKRTFDGSMSNQVDSMTFDILPSRLEDFIRTEPRDDGRFSLGWDPSFEPISDVDGDGLMARIDGGLDPDDNNWDSDDDGLSDAFEMTQRGAGVAMETGLFDSDGDGLTDAQELQAGTDAGVADTDNDGLTDGEEVRHPVFVVNPDTGLVEFTGELAGGWEVTIPDAAPEFTVVVSSDPQSADGDNDGISDGAERQLAGSCDVPGPPAGCADLRLDADRRPYHPNVPNVNPIQIGMRMDDGRTFVRAGDTLDVTSDVVTTAPLAFGVLDASLPEEFGPSPAPSLLSFQPSTSPVGQPQTESASATTTVTIPDALSSQDFVVRSTVRARLEGTDATPPVMEIVPQSPFDPGQDFGDVEVVAQQRDRMNAYVIAETNSDSNGLAGPDAQGNTRNILIPSRTEVHLDQDEDNTVTPSRPDFRYRQGVHGPSVACTDDGTCMTVWEQYDNCNEMSVNFVQVIDADDDDGGIEPLIYLNRNGGDPELLWDVQNYFGNMEDYHIRGPNKDGLPAQVYFCGPAGLTIREFDPDKQDQYQYTTLNADGKFRVGNGDYFTFDQETTGTQRITFSDLDYRNWHDVSAFGFPRCSGLGIYCNRVDIEVTFADLQRHRIATSLSGPDGDVISPQSHLELALSTDRDVNPVISSDGDDFTVTWTRLGDAGDSIMAQRFSGATGEALGSVQTVRDAPGIDGADLDAAFLGDREVVAFSFLNFILAPNTRLADDYRGRTDPSGSDTFDLVYGEPNDEALLVYERNDGRIAGRLLDRAALARPGPLEDSVALFDEGRSPHATFNPLTGGWVVTAETASGLSVVSLDRSLQMLQEDTVTQPRVEGSSVACPGSSALPLADLRFEELPGSTTFVDSSLYGNDATTTADTSPVVAVAGAPDASLSDFALSFRNATDRVTSPSPMDGDVSIAFWYRSDRRSEGQSFVVGAGPSQGYHLAIASDPSGDITWSVGEGTATMRASGVNDGDWHFVVATRDASNGNLAIQLDAGTPARGTGSTAPLIATETTIGGASGVSIDHVRMYDTVLSEPNVNDLFTRAANAFCASAVRSNASATEPGQFTWQQLTFAETDNRGGRIDPNAALTLRVDNDLPSSSVQALPENQSVPESELPQSVIISGSATDATSGVALVEVQVNGGAWEPANGAESWSFAVPATDGAYEVRSRATDSVGLVEEPIGEAVTFRIDTEGPAVSIDPLSATPVAVTRPSDADVPQVRVTGTATDAGSGVVPAGVEVRLIPVESTPLEQGWQTATLTDGVWEIDYAFASADVDVSGRYRVEARAEDRSGNISVEGGATTILTVDATAPAASLSLLDADRRFIADAITIEGEVTDLQEGGQQEGAGIASVEVALTSLQAVRNDPSAVDARNWVAADVTQTGAGVVRGDWSYTIPEDYEGFVQLDLRATDVLGNRTETLNAWRGVIDTLAPRLTLEATLTGRSHGNGRRFGVAYRCSAEDFLLDEAQFACPGETLKPAVRTFGDDADVQALFPDQPMLTGLQVDYTRWERAARRDATVLRACDRFGNCASTSIVAAELSGAASSFSGVPTASLNAVVVAPAPGEHVAVTGTLDVNIAAEAAGFIKSISVALDGAAVERRDFPDGSTRVLETVIPVAVTEGIHQLAVTVEDWAGGTSESSVVEFVADTSPPVVTIDGSDLTSQDTWTAGSNVFRFHGAVSDGGQVAAVQIRVGDRRWTDVMFDATSWRGALHIPDADGQTLALSVRAFDLAGRSTEISSTSRVDLAPVGPGAFQRPSTEVDPGPSGPDVTDSATFTFAATAGDSELAGFFCRTDDRPARICESPWTVTDLSVGQHRFTVAAVDATGLRDLTPAEWQWTVPARGPQPLFTAGPHDPSPERSTTIAFSSVSSATFACALDDQPFAPCTGPQLLTDLSDGPHTFAVRVTVAGVTGTAAAYRWIVANDTPAAADQHVGVSTSDQDGRLVTLQATDADELTYRVVDTPQHGYLDGTAPDLTYVPFTDYVGWDSLTFTATDGQATSNLATVTFRVAPPGGPGPADDDTVDSSGDGDGSPVGVREVTRLSGSSRIETAVAVSRATFTQTGGTVFVATAGTYPDALAAGPVGGSLPAPILLTGSTLPPVVAEEIQRLAPSRIVILGGNAAVTAEVEQALRALAPVVERISGRDRFETAAGISRAQHPDGSAVVYVARADDFADALAGGVAASLGGGPILLSATNQLPSATETEIIRLQPDRIVLLGGEAALSADLAASIADVSPASTVERLAGTNRFHTAAVVSASAFESAEVVYIATGGAFPDALAGVPPAVQAPGPLLLVDNGLPDITLAEIRRLGAQRVVILGGPAAVSEEVAAILGRGE